MERSAIWRGPWARSVALVRSATAETLLASGLTAGCGVLLSIYVVRTLGAEGRGQLSAALLWPALLVYVGNMGFMPALIYHVGRATTSPSTWLSSALAVAVLQSGVTVTIGYVALPYVLSAQPQQVVADARIGLLLVPTSFGFLYSLTVLQARLHFRAYNVLRAAVPVWSLAAILLLAQGQPITIRLLVVVPIVFNAAGTVACLLVCSRLGLFRPGLPDRKAVRALFHYGLRAQLGDIAVLSNLRLDQILLAAFAAPRVLGLFVIALSMSTFLAILTGSLRAVLQPRVAGAAREGRASAVVRQGLSRYCALGGVVYALSALSAPFVLPLLFGDAARSDGCIEAAEILLLANFLFGVKEMCAASLQALGEPWAVSRTDLGSLVVTVAGLAAATRYGGLVEVAAVSLVAYGGQAAVLVLVLRRRLRVDRSAPRHDGTI